MKRALLLLVLAACRKDGMGPVREPPQTEAACHACRGSWGVHGLAPTPSCLCATRDAGKRCRDGRECEGECIADDAAPDVVDPGPPARGFFVGRCTPYDHVFGCEKILGDGTVARGPVLLDQPPETTCID